MAALPELPPEAIKSSLLRFSTAGSVDDGKSTLIGRLLHDTKNVYEDHLAALHRAAQKRGENTPQSLALLTDGLKAEREQGITIDVAYRYFSTPKRRFILADSPGHEQYTRNMATGASTADLTVILIDARKGVVTQTKRHSFIASLLGVPRLVVAVNKMDLVDYSQARFEEITAEYTEFASKLGIREVRFIPVSALAGDNVVTRGTSMPWYGGETLMEYLENVYIAGDSNQVDFRFPVQCVLRPDQNYRGYAGQVASGYIRTGEEVMVLPSMQRSTIRSIDVFGPGGTNLSLESAAAPMSVSVTLEDEIDIARGSMLVRPENLPHVQSHFEGMLVWMDESPMEPDTPYIVMHASRDAKIHIDEIKYVIDVNTMHRGPGRPLALNEIGRAQFTSTKPLMLDPYQKNRATGSFILVEPESFRTVAAGMVLDRVPKEVLDREARGGGTPVSTDIHREESLVSADDRARRYGYTPVTVWCTGLSGSGKSSVAKGIERTLFERGQIVYRLDGDNLRQGLNRDLGFSKTDRAENIRRAAEVAKLLNQAGVTVVCSFISPFAADRAAAREIIGENSFVELYLSTPLSVCEERDPHGLYRKARAGQIEGFTGVSAPYEPPVDPDIVINTAECSVDESVETVYKALKSRKAAL